MDRYLHGYSARDWVRVVENAFSTLDTEFTIELKDALLSVSFHVPTDVWVSEEKRRTLGLVHDAKHVIERFFWHQVQNNRHVVEDSDTDAPLVVNSEQAWVADTDEFARFAMAKTELSNKLKYSRDKVLFVYEIFWRLDRELENRFINPDTMHARRAAEQYLRKLSADHIIGLTDEFIDGLIEENPKLF